MIEIIKYPERTRWPKLIQRPTIDDTAMRKTVQTILQGVKKDGDVALMEYEEKFGGSGGNLTELTDELKFAIQQAKANIERFHFAQFKTSRNIEKLDGITRWTKLVAIEKVGLYIPGGTAPLFSTVLMLAIPAMFAGCKEIILCTPASPPLLNERQPSEAKVGSEARGGEVHPAIKYTANLCGISKIFAVGGAQAIAAMAYGTETIPKVDKIFGPGNPYVTIAKQLVQLEGVAIDMPAGPSELLVIADETAIPSFVAADLLSQAEHGPDSQVILITNDELLAAEVVMELNAQIQKLPRKNIAEQSLRNSKLILVDKLEEAIELSNAYAPEHLIIATEEPELIAEHIINAGSVFLGNYSPEAAGDYASGTNHVLPTNGYARSYSGVSVESFMKKISFQKLTKQGLENIGKTVTTMAEAEGLQAHSNAIKIRL